MYIVLFILPCLFKIRLVYSNLCHGARMIQNHRGQWQTCFHVVLMLKETEWKNFTCHIYSLTMYKQPIHIMSREHNHENASSMLSIDWFNQANLWHQFVIQSINAVNNHIRDLHRWLILVSYRLIYSWTSYRLFRKYPSMNGQE